MMSTSSIRNIHSSHHRPFRLTDLVSATTTTSAAYLALAILTITSSFCLGSPCHNTESWWNHKQHKCIPCTRCEDHQIILRPCQLHQDTVCGTIHDIPIDWNELSKTEPNWKERRKLAAQEFENNRSIMDFETLKHGGIFEDWQAICLVVAIVACLIFFIAAAVIFLKHMRQWRRMERRLDQDVEELSAKLMSKLAEVQNIENGTFLIENPLKDQGTMPVEVRCVYLEQLLAGKERMRTPNRGNLYIEEAATKG